MTVAKITPELAGEIDGTPVLPNGRLFNPVIDGNGDTIISLVEAQFLRPDQFEPVEWIAPQLP